MAKQTVVDPWLDDKDGFTRVDFQLRPEDAIDPDDNRGLDQIQGLDPEIVGPKAPSEEPDPEPVAIIPPPEPEPETPETFELEDGTQLTLEKDKGQWKGSVIGITGNPQVYWGKNKNELIINILKAQANATKKIREQNLKLKFGDGTTPKPVAPVQTAPVVRELSADEVVEIKLLLESNPALAFETWFQKRAGKTLDELVSQSNEGRQASLELQAEAVSKEFTTRNPDYFGDPEWKNFSAIVKWVAKYKFGHPANDANVQQRFNELVASGHWTVDNLEEAFEDLKEDMVRPPKPPKTPTPVAVLPEPAPAPRQPDERIVRVETRPRAATGLRPSDVTPAALPETPKAPSAEDLESMTDSQIKQLLGGVQRLRAQSRRSN
jgi:hypothetical protein